MGKAVSLIQSALHMSQAYLALDEAEAPSMKTMALAASQMTAVSGNTFVFKFNPLSYSMEKSSNWASEPQSSAEEAPESNFVGPSPRNMTIEIFMDDSWKPMLGSIQPEIDFLMKCCDPTPESVAEKKPRPPYVRFGWGSNVLFKAYVSHVTVDVSLFSSGGAPMRGTAHVTLVEVPETLPGQNPTSGTPNPQRAHQIEAGDSLASIAYKYWKNPTLWRAIAEVNRIDDPEHLTPGTEVLIPDEAEARALG